MSKKILVVDDERPILEMFGLLLGALGYNCLLAESGARALELFSAEQPDIIITDVKMPIMDGMQLLDRLQAEAPGTPVLVVSGHGDIEMAMEALDRHATAFLYKPLQRDQLEAALAEAERRLPKSVPAAPFSLIRQDDAAILTLDAPLNASAGPFLEEAFSAGVAERLSRIVLRFSPQTTINGAGAALLCQRLVKADAAAIAWTVEDAAPWRRAMLELAGVASLVAFHPPAAHPSPTQPTTGAP